MPLNAKELTDYKPTSGFGPSLWFRPKPNEGGETRRYDIRVVMHPNSDTPFFDARIHYFRYGGEFFSGACPRHIDEPCLACDMFFALRQLPQFAGDEPETKARSRRLGKISANTRVYMNVLDRAAKRIQVWSMPYGVFEDVKQNLVVYINDGVDLTDPEAGRDLVISVSKKGAVQKYGSISVRPSPSPLGLEDWVSQLHDLKAMAFQRQFKGDDMEKHIAGQLGEVADEWLAAYENILALKEASEPVKKPSVTEIKDDEADDSLGEKV